MGREDSHGPHPLQLIGTCQNGPAEHGIGVLLTKPHLSDSSEGKIQWLQGAQPPSPFALFSAIHL